MKFSKAKTWVKLVLCYWLVMAAIFILEFRYLESDWAGLPSFILTFPLSPIAVTIGFLPEIADYFGYVIPIKVSDYHFEFGLMVCAFLNPFILYPIYLLWANRKRTQTYKLPPPPESYSL